MSLITKRLEAYPRPLEADVAQRYGEYMIDLLARQVVASLDTRVSRVVRVFWTGPPDCDVAGVGHRLTACLGHTHDVAAAVTVTATANARRYDVLVHGHYVGERFRAVSAYSSLVEVLLTQIECDNIAADTCIREQDQPTEFDFYWSGPITGDSTLSGVTLSGVVDMLNSDLVAAHNSAYTSMFRVTEIVPDEAAYVIHVKALVSGAALIALLVPYPKEDELAALANAVLTAPGAVALSWWGGYNMALVARYVLATTGLTVVASVTHNAVAVQRVDDEVGAFRRVKRTAGGPETVC